MKLKNLIAALVLTAYSAKAVYGQTGSPCINNPNRAKAEELEGNPCQLESILLNYDFMLPVENLPDIYRRAAYNTRDKRSFASRRRGDYHDGIDYSGLGYKVLAAERGKVVFKGRDIKYRKDGRYNDFGELMVISHGNGLDTFYVHANLLKKIKVDDYVNRGDHIGYTDHMLVKKGCRTVNNKKVCEKTVTNGPHLHFAVVRNREFYLQPALLFNDDYHKGVLNSLIKKNAKLALPVPELWPYRKLESVSLDEINSNTIYKDMEILIIDFDLLLHLRNNVFNG